MKRQLRIPLPAAATTEVTTAQFLDAWGEMLHFAREFCEAYPCSEDGQAQWSYQVEKMLASSLPLPAVVRALAFQDAIEAVLHYSAPSERKKSYAAARAAVARVDPLTGTFMDPAAIFSEAL